MPLPTTLLRHNAPTPTPGNGGSGNGVGPRTPPPPATASMPPHYDWLILDPLAHRDPALGLWTARVSVHWRDWAAIEQLDLTPLPRHRRRYLNWQGNLTGQRGWVQQVGVGQVLPHLWTPGRIELSLIFSPDHPPLHLSLRPLGPRWRAVVTTATH